MNPESSVISFKIPLGWVHAGSRDSKLTNLSLTAEKPLGRANLLCNEVLLSLRNDLQRYFSGEVVDFNSYEVDLSELPPFYRRALLAARRIGYGEVRTYAWIARLAGSPAAVRAAGQAMAHNPIPLVIPCHRVIASDGSLGGYGGGLAMKRALLKLEGIDYKCGRKYVRSYAFSVRWERDSVNPATI